MNAVVALALSKVLVTSPSPEPVPVPIEVTVDAQIADGPVLGERLESEAVDAVQQQRPWRPEDPLSIHVGGELLDFRVSVDVAGQRTTTERPCTHGELVAHVRARVTEALETAARIPLRPSLAPSCPVATPKPTPAAIEPRVGMTARGRAGVATLLAGTLVTGVGSGFWLGQAATQTELAAPRFDVRPPAIAALVVGTAAMVTGVALLISERRIRRRAPRTTP